MDRKYYCVNHNSDIVLHAFSDGNCIKCDADIVTEHIPCDKVCEACAEKYDICRKCGERLKEKVEYDGVKPSTNPEDLLKSIYYVKHWLAKNHEFEFAAKVRDLEKKLEKKYNTEIGRKKIIK